MGLHVVHVESESKPDMCFTSLVLLRVRLPSALDATEIVTAAWKGGPAPLSSPPYESHLRRRPRPRRRRLARYYSGHVLFSFIFYGAEYGEPERDEEGDSGEGGKEEGRKEGSMARLLSVVALRCNTGARLIRLPDWIKTAVFIQSVTRFHSFGNSIWLFG